MAGNAKAAELNFSQSILPVKLVYLAENEKVENIWSNVSENDNAYVVKFFDPQQKEIKASLDILFDYQKKIDQTDNTSGGNGPRLCIQFLKNQDKPEEVQTYV